MKTKHYVLPVLVVLICTLIVSGVFPEEVLARAGGGGGGKGGGILGIILAPFFMIYSAIVTHFLVKKNKKCRSLLEQIAGIDSSWELANIKARVEVSFFKVQEAWMKRDQEIAKDYVSERLYQKHKAQTDLLIAQNRKNMLENINLAETKVVEVVDYKDDSRDRFWVHIKGSMVDYTIDTNSGSVVSGDKSESEAFAELWKYVRGPKGWVLDEIDQKVQIGDLTGFKSFSEEIG